MNRIKRIHYLNVNNIVACEFQSITFKVVVIKIQKTCNRTEQQTIKLRFDFIFPFICICAQTFDL